LATENTENTERAEVRVKGASVVRHRTPEAPFKGHTKSAKDAKLTKGGFARS
jgi:hypothetical protein